VKLKAFHKFDDTAEAVQSATALVEGKLSSGMKKFLKKNVVAKELKARPTPPARAAAAAPLRRLAPAQHTRRARSPQDQLAVADDKLGRAINEKLSIPCIWDESVLQLMRGLRSQIEELVEEASGSEMRSMAIGLAHSLSRYKLKFSPDKVDTMIVQARPPRPLFSRRRAGPQRAPRYRRSASWTTSTRSSTPTRCD
jgi:nucleolar protein 58